MSSGVAGGPPVREVAIGVPERCIDGSIFLGLGHSIGIVIIARVVGHLRVGKAPHVPRGLHIRTQVENVYQHLHVPHALLITAMLPRRQQGLAVLGGEYRR